MLSADHFRKPVPLSPHTHLSSLSPIEALDGVTHGRMFLLFMEELEKRKKGESLTVDIEAGPASPADVLRQHLNKSKPVNNPMELRFNHLLQSGVLPTDFSALRAVAMQFGFIIVTRPVKQGASIAKTLAELLGLPTMTKPINIKDKSDAGTGMVKPRDAKRGRRGSVFEAMDHTKSKKKEASAPLDIPASFIASLAGRIKPPKFTKIGDRIIIDIASRDPFGSIKLRFTCADAADQVGTERSFFQRGIAQIPDSFIQTYMIQFAQRHNIPMTPEGFEKYDNKLESDQKFFPSLKRAWKESLENYIPAIFGTTAKTVEEAIAEIKANISELEAASGPASGAGASRVEGDTKKLDEQNAKLILLERIKAHGKGMNTLFRVLNLDNFEPYDVVIKDGRLVVTDLDAHCFIPLLHACTPDRLETLLHECGLIADHTLPPGETLDPHNHTDFRRLLEEPVPLELLEGLDLKGVDTRVNAMLTAMVNHYSARQREARALVTNVLKYRLMSYALAMRNVGSSTLDVGEVADATTRAEALAVLKSKDEERYKIQLGQFLHRFRLGARRKVKEDPTLKHGGEAYNPYTPSPIEPPASSPHSMHLAVFPNGDHCGILNTEDFGVLLSAITQKWGHLKPVLTVNALDKPLVDLAKKSLSNHSSASLLLAQGAVYYRLRMLDIAWLKAARNLMRVELALSRLIRDHLDNPELQNMLVTFHTRSAELASMGDSISEDAKWVQALPTLFVRSAPAESRLAAYRDKMDDDLRSAQRLVADTQALFLKMQLDFVPDKIPEVPPSMASMIWGQTAGTPISMDRLCQVERRGVRRDPRIVELANILHTCKTMPIIDVTILRFIIDVEERLVPAIQLPGPAALTILKVIAKELKDLSAHHRSRTGDEAASTKSALALAPHRPQGPIDRFGHRKLPVMVPSRLPNSISISPAAESTKHEMDARREKSTVGRTAPASHSSLVLAVVTLPMLPGKSDSATHALERADRSLRAEVRARRLVRQQEISAALSAGRSSQQKAEPKAPKMMLSREDQPAHFQRRPGGSPTKYHPRLGMHVASTFGAEHHGRTKSRLAAAGAASLTPGFGSEG